MLKTIETPHSLSIYWNDSYQGTKSTGLTSCLPAFAHVREGKAVGHVGICLSIHLHIRKNKIIQPLIVLVRTQFQVAPHRELDPVDVVRAKEVVFLLRVFPRFRNVHRDPAALTGVELRPAVISSNLRRVTVFRHWRTPFRILREKHTVRRKASTSLLIEGSAKCFLL